MYFKLDESLAHSSLNFRLELAIATVKVYLNIAGRRVNAIMHI